MKHSGNKTNCKYYWLSGGLGRESTVGASTGEGGIIRNQAGEVIEGLYTLGSTQKGRLYESIAVPELRSQAADLAARLLADFRKPFPAAAPEMGRQFIMAMPH